MLLSSILLRDAAFLPLLWVGLLFFSLFCWVVLLGLLLWAVLLFQSPFRWCCLPSSPLGGAMLLFLLTSPSLLACPESEKDF